jgi:hypothetical protein
VSLVMVIVLSSVGGLGATLMGPFRRRASIAVGVTAALLTFIIATTIRTDETVTLAGALVMGSSLVRTMAMAWAAGAAILGLLDLGIGGTAVVVGPTLVGLSVGVLALALPDPATAYAALGGGGVAAVLVPTLQGWEMGRRDPRRLAIAIRAAWAVIGASIVGIGVVAWGASPAGPLGAFTAGDTTTPEVRLAFGLGLLAIVIAVVLRSGLIPAHLWAARFFEGAPSLAVPAALGWGAAAFMLVSLGWAQVALGPTLLADGPERPTIVAIALLSIVLGGLAAMLHDDIEHILGYSVVQDAGIALLAFSSLQPGDVGAATDWLLAAVTLKTAMAAWAAATRNVFGVHRLRDLEGWARHSPLLAFGYLLIAIGIVGVPGMAAFDGRLELIDAAVGGPLVVVVLVAAFTPVVYLGRTLVAGLREQGPTVRLGLVTGPRLHGVRTHGWTSSGAATAIRALPQLARDNRPFLVVAGVAILAGIGLAVAIAGAVGTTPFGA